MRSISIRRKAQKVGLFKKRGEEQTLSPFFNPSSASPAVNCCMRVFSCLKVSLTAGAWWGSMTASRSPCCSAARCHLHQQAWTAEPGE